MSTPDPSYPVTAAIVRELRAAIRQSELTQAEIAGRAGITNAALSMILSRKTRASKYLAALFAVLDIPRYRLYRLDEIEIAWLAQLDRLRTEVGDDQSAYFTRRLRELVDREIAIGKSRK